MNGFDVNITSVSDPTDFPPANEAPGLRSLDASLRCEICGETFDAPVVLPCGHTFCSLCVRSSLKERQGCPNCRKPVNEFQLVRNLVLEQTVDQWNTARPYILQLLSNEKSAKAELKAKPTEPPTKKRKDKIVVDHSPYKRRKQSEYDEPATPTKSRSKPTSTESNSHKSDFELGASSPRSSKSAEHVPTSDVEEEEEIEVSESAMVACPICNKSTRSDRINEHIDSGCRAVYSSEGSTSKAAQIKQKQAWQGIFQSNASTSGNGSSKAKGKARATQSPEDEDERLPKVAYDVLKEKAIRDLLAKHDLPTTGSKQVLVARHERYVMLYNANLDRSRQKRQSSAEIRKEVLKWEQQQRRENEAKAKKSAATTGSSREYEIAHKTQFQALAAAARDSRTRARTHPTVKNDNNVDTTPEPAITTTESAKEAAENATIVLDSEGEM